MSPLDQFKDLETRIRALLYRGSGSTGLLFDLSQVPGSAIARAIRTNSIAPITESAEYRSAFAKATQRLAKIEHVSLRRAARAALNGSGVRGLPLHEIFGDSAGSQRAAERLLDFDQKARLTLRRMVRNAHGRYRRGSSSLLDEMVEDLRPHIGMAPGQSKILAKWQKRSHSSGMKPARFRAEQRRRWTTQSRNRVRQIASFDIASTYNQGSYDSYVAAVEKGLLPTSVRKRAVTAGDDRVRDDHDRQSKMRPVRLEEPFQLFGDLFPPWSGEIGCRCTFTIESGDGRLVGTALGAAAAIALLLESDEQDDDP